MSNHIQLSDIMRPAITIGEESTLRDALHRMNREKTNELLVVDEDGMLTGEVSVTDLLAAIVPEDLDGDKVLAHMSDEDAIADAVKNAADKPITECMSYNVETVHADASLIDIASTAIAMGQARIPVVDQDNRPVGIISRIGLKHILSNYLGME